MKLIWRLTIRISLLMVIILAVWAVLFHHAVIDEVNDETDDALELFAENLIMRSLHGEALPTADNGTNNTYYIQPVTAEYASTHPRSQYSNEPVYVTSKGEEEPSRVLRTIFRDAEDRYFLLLVASPTIETDDLREAISNWIVWLFSMLLLATIAVCLWVLRRSMRPLYRLLRWLDDNDVAHGSKPLDNPTSMPEFVRLNDALVRYTQRNEQLYAQQKQFTGNASHEIQTPIAVCKNRLEILAETPLSELQLGEVVKIGQTLEQISRLNRELLLLSKIDFQQFTDCEPIDLAVLIRAGVEDCQLVYAHRELSIAVDLERLPVQMDPTLARILVTNLVKNAFVHNRQRGEIRITQTASGVCFVNSGDCEPLDAEQIFLRFYQGRKRAGSTGLGLALAKAISNQYGFSLTYNYQEGLHSFLLNLH